MNSFNKTEAAFYPVQAMLPEGFTFQLIWKTIVKYDFY